MLTIREFLRKAGANFIHCKKTALKGYEGMEYGVKGQPAMGMCFFSKKIRESGSLPTEGDILKNLDGTYAVYETTTGTGVSGYTLGMMGEVMVEGTEVTL